nr:GGDEF domain-containing protein [Kangiella sp. HZ709]
MALSNILKAHYYLTQEDFNKAREFLIKAKPLVDLIQSDKLTNEYLFANMFVLRSSSEIDAAIEIGETLYKKVMESWPKHKLSHLVLEQAYLKSFKYKYDESLDLLKLALDYSYESNDPFQVAETYNLFGIIYSELNDESSANEYYKKAVDIVELHPGLSRNTYLYTNLADSYRVLKDFDDASFFLDKSEKLAKEDEDVAGLAFSYQMRSRLLVDQKDYANALNYLKQAQEISDKIGEKLFNYEIHSELAYLYLMMDQLDKAEEHLDIAAANDSKQNDSDKFYMEGIRSSILYEKGLYKEAYDKLEESYENYRTQFNDDLVRVSNLSREQLDQAQLNFDNKLLAKENELTAKNMKESERFNLLLWILIGLLLLSAIILIVYIYRYRQLAIRNRHLAYTDNLTRLPNRRHVFLQIEEYHKKSKHSSFQYSVIIFDIDHFKGINDRFGHHIGDKVIKATKDICESTLSASDVVGRIGGEEFLILLPKTNETEAYRVADKIREQFENYDFGNLAEGLKVTASFGVAEVRTSDQNVDVLINRADRLMYEAKNTGRNRVMARSTI